MDEPRQSSVICSALRLDDGKVVVQIEINDDGTGESFGFQLSPATAAEVARSLAETAEDATALGVGIQ